LIWIGHACGHLLRHWARHWTSMVFLGWIMDLGIRIRTGWPQWQDPELWERWVFISLLLMPLSLFSALHGALNQWRQERTLWLLQYTHMGWQQILGPFLIFFLVPLMLWGGLREVLQPHLMDWAGRQSVRDRPMVFEEKGTRWTLFPSREMTNGQALVEDQGELRHYQGWSWGPQGILLDPGENLSQMKALVADQTSLRKQCPSFEFLMILRGMGSGMPLWTLWDYRHLPQAFLEIAKRCLQPLVLFLFLLWHWRAALRFDEQNLGWKIARSSLIFGFFMLALEILG